MVYSGKFVLRIPERLHEQLAQQAEARGLSLNRMCLSILQSGTTVTPGMAISPSRTARIPRNRPGDSDIGGGLPCFLIDHFTRRFGDRLLGIYFFGSRVKGEARPDSDLDVLVILSSDEPIQKSLYTWWDEEVDISRTPFELNPHFVHLPVRADDVGGLWYEVAMNSQLIWQKDARPSSFLSKVRGAIADGRVRRHWESGHPYWVRQVDEE